MAGKNKLREREGESSGGRLLQRLTRNEHERGHRGRDIIRKEGGRREDEAVGSWEQARDIGSWFCYLKNRPGQECDGSSLNP